MGRADSDDTVEAPTPVVPEQMVELIMEEFDLSGIDAGGRTSLQVALHRLVACFAEVPSFTIDALEQSSSGSCVLCRHSRVAPFSPGRFSPGPMGARHPYRCMRQHGGCKKNPGAIFLSTTTSNIMNVSNYNKQQPGRSAPRPAASRQNHDGGFS